MFLLKGHEDLRQDERVMQLFGLVNTLLLNDPDTFRRNLTIQVSIIHDYFMHYSARVLYFSLNQPSFVVFFCDIISLLALQACHTCSVVNFTIGCNLCMCQIPVLLCSCLYIEISFAFVRTVVKDQNPGYRTDTLES